MTSAPAAPCMRWSPLLAWALYLPLGAKYALALGGAALAVQQLHRRGQLPQVLRHPGTVALLALLAWLTLSAAWSPATGPRIASHLWTYALPLLLPLLASAMHPAWAHAALRQFCLASAAVGGVFVLHHLGLPTETGVWSSTVAASGNQRIATSVLLALGSTLALWQCSQEQGRRSSQCAWIIVALLAAAGLALQDRRSGMVLLPLLLAVGLLHGVPTLPRRAAALVALALACALTWTLADGVRQRFDEGLRELRADTSADTVATSWGQRVRMLEITADMIAQRPWRGHGVASWVPLWRQRVAEGTLLHEQTTPHDEYLLLAQQGGLPALALALAAGLALLRAALAAGTQGTPLLLVCTAVATTGLFNAVLRDAKFSLPLLLLAAAAAALGDGTRRSP